MAPERQHQRLTRDGVGDDSALETENGADVVTGEHPGRITRRVDPAIGHGDEEVGVAGGEIEIVQNHDNRCTPSPVQVGEQVQDLNLVAHVQEGSRLVEKKQIGLLGERHRNPHTLALTTGKLVHRSFGQSGCVRCRKRLGDGGVILATPPRQHPLMWMSASADEIGDNYPFRCDR